MKYCACIVTFNPDIESLKTNINAIVFQVQKLYIVDNCSSNVNEIRQVISSLNSYDKIVLLCEPNNKGIASALNIACRKALSEGFGWILTLDQDSVCPENLVEKLAVYVSRENAIISPNIIYKNNESFANINNDSDFTEVCWTITSSSLTNLDAWAKIGGFDDALFIDGVDYDFCTRLKKAGYKIIKVFSVRLLHELGSLKCKSILGHTVYVTNHSPWRRFYMARNVVYLDKKLGEHRRITYIMKMILKVLFFEHHKVENFRYIMKGAISGMKMKIPEV
jgi:rhamnosyltransferase